MEPRRIRWISPTDLGTTIGLVAGGVTLPWVVLVSVVLLVSQGWAAGSMEVAEVMIVGMMPIILPALYFAIGWMGGFVAAAAYNWVSSHWGWGLRVGLDEVATDRDQHARS